MQDAIFIHQGHSGNSSYRHTSSPVLRVTLTEFHKTAVVAVTVVTSQFKIEKWVNLCDASSKDIEETAFNTSKPSVPIS